jgi:energy-converting hydrogenase Eha subunit E
MIKTFIAVVAAVAIYVALGIMLPITGHTAVVFPALQVVPAVGLWLCFLTYKGIAALAALSAIAKV